MPSHAWLRPREGLAGNDRVTHAYNYGIKINLRQTTVLDWCKYQHSRKSCHVEIIPDKKTSVSIVRCRCGGLDHVYEVSDEQDTDKEWTTFVEEATASNKDADIEADEEGFINDDPEESACESDEDATPTKKRKRLVQTEPRRASRSAAANQKRVSHAPSSKQLRWIASHAELPFDKAIKSDETFQSLFAVAQCLFAGEMDQIETQKTMKAYAIVNIHYTDIESVCPTLAGWMLASPSSVYSFLDAILHDVISTLRHSEGMPCPETITTSVIGLPNSSTVDDLTAGDFTFPGSLLHVDGRIASIDTDQRLAFCGKCKLTQLLTTSQPPSCSRCNIKHSKVYRDHIITLSSLSKASRPRTILVTISSMIDAHTLSPFKIGDFVSITGVHGLYCDTIYRSVPDRVMVEIRHIQHLELHGDET